MSISGIYAIDCLANKKRYVGSSKNLQGRKAEHLRRLRNNDHANRYLQFAWSKYGEDKFIFKTLLICSKEELLFYEQKFIDLFETYGKGFNLRPKAENNLGVRYSEEICKKNSEAHKGRIVSLATRKKLSESLKGKNVWSKGRSHSVEARQKMSNSNMGRIVSVKTRKKISDAERGKFVSEKTKSLISKAGKGRPSWNKGIKTEMHSDSAKQRMSASQRERWSKVTAEEIQERKKKILAATTSEQRSEFIKRGWETRRRNILCQL